MHAWVGKIVRFNANEQHGVAGESGERHERDANERGQRGQCVRTLFLHYFTDHKNWACV